MTCRSDYRPLSPFMMTQIFSPTHRSMSSNGSNWLDMVMDVVFDRAIAYSASLAVEVGPVVKVQAPNSMPRDRRKLGPHCRLELGKHSLAIGDLLSIPSVECLAAMPGTECPLHRPSSSTWLLDCGLSQWLRLSSRQRRHPQAHDYLRLAP